MDQRRTRRGLAAYVSAGSLPFWGIHAAALVGVALVGFSWTGVILVAALYVARMFFVTAGYHRYFAHRSYKTSRPVQAALAFFAQTSMQRGALWWAGHHRLHHRFSDTPDDVHSAKQDGFWWAHLGWMLSGRHDATELGKLRDLARYPELRWLNRWPHLPGILLAVALLAIGGWPALVWGFFVSTVLCWHGTFAINSLAHLIGRRRFATSDDSRNSWVLAVLTLGEGWHNNHHHYQSSARQGFRWWELDLSFYVLFALERLGVIWDLRRPPARLLAPPPVEAAPSAPVLDGAA